MAEKFAQLLTALAVLLLAAIAFVGGLGFLAAAAYAGLAQTMPAAAAAAIVGVGGLILSLLLLLVARAVTKPGARPKPAGDAAGGSDFEDAARLGAQLGPLVRRHWKSAAAGAFAFGLVLGISPEARRTLADTVRKQL